MKFAEKLNMIFESTDEKEAFFNKRTAKHISLVQKYARKIGKLYPKLEKELNDQASEHDASKYKSPEKEPYVEITWDYKCKAEGKKNELPADCKDKMNQASEHHVKSNKHHPEYHAPQTKNLINRENRDKPPEEMIDATKMDDVSILEMLADWLAMSEEKGTDPKEWVKKNVGVRWKFTDKQKEIIDNVVEKVEVER